MSFQFSLIRFVPDPARGEFVNIGAIAGSDDAGEWELRLVSNLSRAKALDDRGVLSRAFAYAAALEDNIAALDRLPETDGAEPISSEFLRRRAAEMHNIVQFSPPAPVVADSAEAALDLIFDQSVLDAARKRFPFEKKHRAQGAARRAYQAHDVPAEAVRERAPVRSGVFRRRVRLRGSQRADCSARSVLVVPAAEPGRSRGTGEGVVLARPRASASWRCASDDRS